MTLGSDPGGKVDRMGDFSRAVLVLISVSTYKLTIMGYTISERKNIR